MAANKVEEQASEEAQESSPEDVFADFVRNANAAGKLSRTVRIPVSAVEGLVSGERPALRPPPMQDARPRSGIVFRDRIPDTAEEMFELDGSDFERVEDDEYSDVTPHAPPAADLLSLLHEELNAGIVDGTPEIPPPPGEEEAEPMPLLRFRETSDEIPAFEPEAHGFAIATELVIETALDDPEELDSSLLVEEDELDLPEARPQSVPPPVPIAAFDDATVDEAALPAALRSVIEEGDSDEAPEEFDVPDVARISPPPPPLPECGEDGQIPAGELDRFLRDMAVLKRYGHAAQVRAGFEELLRRYPEDLLLLKRVAEFYVETAEKDAAMELLFSLAGRLFERRNVIGMREALGQVLVLEPENRRATKLLSLLGQRPDTQPGV